MANCEADKCNAFCCTYISVHIDTPKTKVDFDELEWFLAHENISAYKDDENDWILEIMTPCKNLKDNKCAVYENRPNVCRQYDPDNCTHNSEEIPTKILFRTSEEVRTFADKRWNKMKKAAKKAAAKKKAAGAATAKKKTTAKKKK